MPAVESASIGDNPNLYRLLASLLRSQPHIYNFYVGYDDGAFLEMDALEHVGADIRASLQAPDTARFRLVHISAADGVTPASRHTFFLDDSLSPVKEVRGPANYDPRTRPWYRGAHDSVQDHVTGPYVFNMGYIGYTVRQPLTGGRLGVLAGDILLRDAERFLPSERLGQTGVVLLVDQAGTLVAHPRLSDLLDKTSAGKDKLSLPILADAGIPGLADAFAAWRINESAVSQFGSEGRTYLTAFHNLTGTGAKLNLAVVAPLDEFFAEIEAARHSLTMMGIAALAAVLPLVLWIGRGLSRSLIAISHETDRIQRFDIQNEPVRINSVIREIDDLGRSIATMRTVVHTFSRFVPKRLVKQLVETGVALRLGGSRREVTVLFTDIENFTDISEKRDPELVMLYTSRYLAALSGVIMEHKGTVDKFVGDSIMAIWNAPARDADHVAHACAAALACTVANRDLNETFQREGWPAYRTRVGLHVGEAVVGNIGSQDRMNYTVLGATVNLAARLEALNKQYGTSILVSESVRERVADRFAFRELGRVKPKGFADDVTIFELRQTGEYLDESDPREQARQFPGELASPLR